MAIHNLFAHLLTCEQSVKLISQEKKTIQLLITSLNRNEQDMQDLLYKNHKTFDQELTQTYLSESNFSSNLTDSLEFNDGILNFNYKFYQNPLPLLDQDTIRRGLFSR